MTILIPSYEPNIRLLELIKSIKEMCDYRIVIVDDGSGEDYSCIFKIAEENGCELISYRVNRGKGHALKMGFNYIKATGEKDGVVCADSDGQHKPQDILKLAKEVRRHKWQIILGCRHFTGKVPLRSRFGNSLTRLVYTLTTGIRIYDTQTGLRGFSAEMLDWLCNIPGERFEYEMNMLLDAKRDGYSFCEVEIDTVYENKNKSSHFRAIKDSARVYYPILKFSASSTLSGLLDFSLLFILKAITQNLLYAVVGARVLSSLFNYCINKYFVFQDGNKIDTKKSLSRYYTLAAVILGLNYGLMYFMNELLGIPLIASKLLTESALYILSFWSQRKFVFKRKEEKKKFIRVY